MTALRYLVIFAAACSAQLQTIQIENHTPRPIEQLYVHAAGSPRGASRGQLAPNATTQVQMKPGNVEVYAVSQKLQVDEHTRDVPEASQQFELRAPAKVIFYDAGADKPAGVDRPNVYGVAFSIPKPKPEPTGP
ncbi:MAG TPA: hypothetical protein VGF94_26525 [Kofleriaceae bacterium]